MKTKSLVLSFILLLAAAFAVQTARASSQYFDENGGNWADTKWSASSAGGSDAVWTSGNDAYFASTAYKNNTMTIANGVSARSVGSFHTVGTGTFTLTGSSFTWTTAGEGFSINAGSTLEIDNVMNGNGGAYFSWTSGTGTLILKGVNTWDSWTQIDSGGTVNIYTSQALGVSTSTSDANLFVGGASTLGFYGGSTITFHQGLGTWQPSGILPYVVFAGNTIAKISPVSLDCTATALSGYNGTHYSQFTCNGTADVIFDGTVSDNGGGFQLYGTGRLVMAGGSSTYTGWTDMTGGNLAIGASSNALGASGNHRSTLAFDSSSVTGCYVGSYGGNQTCNNGQPSIYMSKNGSFNNTNTLTFNATYALDVGNATSSTLGLYNSADVIISGLVISANGLGGTTSSGTGTSGGINLVGTGRIVFSDNNSSGYTGDTYVTGPVFKVTNTSGNAAGGGAVRLNGSTVSGSGTLTGNGIVGTVYANSYGVIAPGDYPNLTVANLTMGTLNLASGGDYKCLIGATSGTAGTSWSLVTCGTLNCPGSGSFLIDVTMVNSGSLGLPAGFNPATSYTWAIINATSISAFNAANFSVSCNALPPSTLSVQQSGNTINLVYTPPTTASTAGVNGLSGQYFNATTPTNGTVQITRIDPLIDFATSAGAEGTPGGWAADSQAIQEVTGDNWSAEWTGLLIPPTTGSYTIFTRSDDGSSVYINGTQVVNNWFAQGMTTRSGTVSLTAGVPTPICVHYYNGASGEGIYLSWTPASGSSNVIPSSALYASPYITTQPSPASQSVNAGSPATFSVTAVNGTCAGTSAPSSASLPTIPNPTYQWQLNGVNISGATASSLPIASVGTGNAGSYTVVVGNSAATMSSSTATLLLNQTISFPNPGIQSFCNQSVTLGATVDSGQPVSYTLLSGPATLNSGVLTFTGAGTITVVASQAGNSTYVAATPVTNSFVVMPVGLIVSGAVANNKVYDGGPVALLDFSGASLVGVCGWDASTTLNTAGAAGQFPDQNIGTNKTVTVSGLVLSGPNAAGYTLTPPVLTANITPAPLNVSASGTLVYGQDPTNAVYTPIFYPLQGTDTTSVITGSADFSTDATATNYINSYVGTNYTVFVDDTGTLASPNYTFVVGTNGILTITPAPLTVTGITASDRIYDAGTDATLNVSAAVLLGVTNGDDVTLDTSGAVGAFADKNVGTGKTVYVSGLVTVGVLGTNYTLLQPTATASIWPLAITVTAASDTKFYDGTTNSDGVPTPSPALAAGDTAGFSQTFDTRNAGTGKTLTPAGMVSDGNGGANYNITFAAVTTGEIDASPITVTAVTDTKPYDGTTSSVGVPTYTALATGDITVSFSQTFDTRNAGTGKTLTPAGVVNDGNGGLNYAYTYAPVTTGEIDAEAITVTAVTDDKQYDGTTSSAGAPTISPALATGDTTTSFSQTFDTRNVGTGKTLTPAGLVNDGNSGLNYTYTYTPVTTGEIDPKPITVAAVTDTKVYDGTTSSTGAPTYTALGAGDTTVSFSQTFDTPDVGTGKTLTPAGLVNDGNSGLNYAYTYDAVATGVITAVGSTTALVSSQNPSTNGVSVTFTATVSSSVGTPTGNVVFLTNGTAMATVALSGGIASASTADLPVGAITVAAQYAAQVDWQASSNSVDQVINSAVTLSTANTILSIVDNGDGTFTLNLLGTPGANYYVVASGDATAPMSAWTPLAGSTNTASSPSGQWSFVVSNAAPQFYRVAAVNPAP